MRIAATAAADAADADGVANGNVGLHKQSVHLRNTLTRSLVTPLARAYPELSFGGAAQGVSVYQR